MYFSIGAQHQHRQRDTPRCKHVILQPPCQGKTGMRYIHTVIWKGTRRHLAFVLQGCDCATLTPNINDNVSLVAHGIFGAGRQEGPHNEVIQALFLRTPVVLA
eukprot:1137343-Pelagomonas_calceolata.AAC.9